MAHAYRSLEPGEQIIISDESRPDLDALARWESIELAEAKKLIAKAESAADEAAAAELAAAALAEKEAAAKAAADLAAAASTPPGK